MKTAGEIARSSDNKKSDGDKEQESEEAKKRMNEERMIKEQRDERYQEMLRTAKVETDILTKALAKADSDKS
eukprot:6468811-Heterocapsa_arctica.AAC.1